MPDGGPALRVIRILLAEDIDLVADAFVALLETEPDFEVVGKVTRGDDVLAEALRTRPDLALLDVDMPGMTGIEATAQLTRAEVGCRVLLLTSLPGSGHIPRALAAGAAGYVVKAMSADELVSAIRAVMAGRTVIDPQLAAEALRTGPSPLSPREAELLRNVDRGLGTQQIADAMFLSPGTVRNYLSAIMAKLDASSREQAASEAKRRGLL